RVAFDLRGVHALLQLLAERERRRRALRRGGTGLRDRRARPQGRRVPDGFGAGRRSAVLPDLRADGPARRGPPAGPPTPALRHQGLFADAKAPRPPSFNEADMSDKPPALAALPLLSAAQVAAIDGEYRARLEALQAVDEGIERIVEALEELGELD